MRKQNMSSHWRKLDHVAFLLMLPFIFVMFIASLAYKVSKDYMQLIVSSCSLILLFLWIIALAYDLTEAKPK
jgi:cell division protein FtsW (lipid II flippase)